MLFSLILSACSDDAVSAESLLSSGATSSSVQSSSSSGPSDRFSLVSTSPAQGETGVARDTKVTLVFSRTVDPATLTGNLTLTQWWDGALVTTNAGTIDSSKNPVIVFTPSATLADEYEFRLHLNTAAIRDSGGTNLEPVSDLVFETGPSLSGEMPHVIRAIPAHNATAVPTGSAIQLVFSEQMAQSTLTASTVRLFPTASPTAPVSASISLSVDKTNLSITPGQVLTPNTAYTLSISRSVKGLSEENMAADYALSFTTGPGPDTTPLTVTAITPANGSTGVGVTNSVRITFSHPVLSSSVFLDYPGTDGSIRVSRYADGSFPLTGSLVTETSGTASSAIFRLPATDAYEAGRTYYIHVNGVKALSGATMSAPWSSSFTVQATTPGTIADLRSINGPCALRVENVQMTFFRNYPDNYRAFFVQAAASGPAIMVLWKSEKAPFHTTDYVHPVYTSVNLNVTFVSEYEGMKQVTACTVEENSAGNKDLTWVHENLLTPVSSGTIDESYEARLVRIDGWLSNYAPGSSTQNREYRLYYVPSPSAWVRLLVNKYLIEGVTKSASEAAAVGKRVRLLAPVQQDSKGYFVKPYYYTTDAGISTDLLSSSGNYHLMLDIVQLTN